MAERITGHTELIGLIATPIRHSSSPRMHNEAFAKLGLDYAYLAFEVGNEELEDTIKGFRAMKVRGSNVSMPNKTVVHKYLDKLSDAAQMCGAVNTIVNDNGVLTGHITDGIGYMSGLKDAGIDIIGKKMTIVGAGGFHRGQREYSGAVRREHLHLRRNAHRRDPGRVMRDLRSCPAVVPDYNPCREVLRKVPEKQHSPGLHDRSEARGGRTYRRRARDYGAGGVLPGGYKRWSVHYACVFVLRWNIRGYAGAVA